MAREQWQDSLIRAWRDEHSCLWQEQHEQAEAGGTDITISATQQTCSWQE